MFTDITIRCFVGGNGTPDRCRQKPFGSLVQQRLKTQYVMAPGINSLRPESWKSFYSAAEICWIPVPNLHFSIPASRKARSKECNSSLCVPTPFVKNIFLGYKTIHFSTPYFSVKGKDFIF